MQRAATGAYLDIMSVAGRTGRAAKRATEVNPYGLLGQQFAGAAAGNTINGYEILKDLVPVWGTIDAIGDARDVCRSR